MEFNSIEKMIAIVGGFLKDFEKAEKMSIDELSKNIARITAYYKAKSGK